MDRNKIIGGTDIKIKFRIKDKDAVEINLNNVEVIIELCNPPASTEWVKTPSADQKQIHITNAAMGECYIIVDRDWTEAQAGKFFDMSLTVIFDTGSEFKNSEQYRKLIWENYLKIQQDC